jgi:hypothetical protein
MNLLTVNTLSRWAHVLKDRLTFPVRRLRHDMAGFPDLVLLLLVVLLFCAVRTLRGDRWAALALIPLSFGWLLFNGPFEGPTLFVISWSHGVTASDLISVVCLALAGWRLAPVVLRRRA